MMIIINRIRIKKYEKYSNLNDSRPNNNLIEHLFQRLGLSICTQIFNGIDFRGTFAQATENADCVNAPV